VKTLHTIPVLAAALAVASPLIAAPVQLEVRPDQKVLHVDDPACIIRIELKGDDIAPSDKRLPINLALVLDRSGSMRGAKLERAIQAAGVALDQLNPEDTVSVVIYDDQVEVLVPPQPAKHPDRIFDRLQSIQAGGSTALYDGVKTGARQLEEFLDEEKINRVLLLSDGLANVGPSSSRALSSLGREVSRRGIAVTTVGLGDDYNEDLMTALAEASQANYYYVSDPEELPKIFAEELRTMKSVVARRIELIIELPEGVRPRGVMGRPDLEFEGNRVKIDLATLNALESRQFLIECAPETDAEKMELANVQVRYETLEGEKRDASKRLSVNRTSDKAAAEASVDREVLASVAMTENRLAKEEAVALADEGKVDEAGEVLKRQIRRNAVVAQQLPAAPGAQLEEENASLSETEQELKSNGGLGKSTRKRIQYENYQDKFDKR